MSVADSAAASPTALPSPLPRLADFVAALGDVPLDRILAYPSIGTATEADLVAVNNQKQVVCELVNGTLVVKSMGTLESELAALIASFLIRFVYERKLGTVLVGDGPVRLAPGLVRLPDVSFISWSRFPGGQRPQTALWDVVPDLAVEVLSSSDRLSEMRAKRAEYFASGVRILWEFDPRSRTATVFTSDVASSTFDATETLHGGDVLPGFTLPLAELFAFLEQRGAVSE